MNATLAVAADYANVASDGKLNIMGIFQEVNPVAFPAMVQQMFLVLTWEAEPAEFGSQRDVRVVFMGPDNSENFNLEYQLVVPEALRPGTRAIFHQILGIGGLTISRSGPHALYVTVGSDTKANVPLHVNEPPETQGREVAGNG